MHRQHGSGIAAPSSMGRLEDGARALYVLPPQAHPWGTREATYYAGTHTVRPGMARPSGAPDGRSINERHANA